MKAYDEAAALVSRKRERDDKDKVDEPALKRPKLEGPEDTKTTEKCEKSVAYKSLFSQPQPERPVSGEGGDFMTRCAKWGLQ